MSHKVLDRHNRWRSKTVAFRMSPEENERLNCYVRLCGMSKQDYIINRLLHREIVVQGNPRVYKALRDQMRQIYTRLCEQTDGWDRMDEDEIELLKLVADTLGGMKEENR